MFAMNTALQQDLGWFWDAWLFTTESVDDALQQVKTVGSRTLVTVRQDGQMPAPIVLRVQFAPTGPALRPLPSGGRCSSRLERGGDSVTALVTCPVDIWFSGQRSVTVPLAFGGRKIVRVTLDPEDRFPDRDPSDNVWPRPSADKPR